MIAAPATDEQVNRAAQAVALARAERRAEQRARSMKVWGHPGAVTAVQPLGLREEIAIALRTAAEVAPIQPVVAGRPITLLIQGHPLRRLYDRRTGEQIGYVRDDKAAAFEARP